MLMAEPEIRLLMQADHVDERELLEMLSRVRVQLRKNSNSGGDPAPSLSASSTFEVDSEVWAGAGSPI